MPRGQFPRKPLAERFWAKVRKSNKCWEWTGAKNQYGYGRIFLNGRREVVTRVVWMLTTGETVSSDLCVLHRCDNPGCCRPDHLFLGTRQDNALDRHAKGRTRPGHVFGELHGGAKLTLRQVDEIRRCSVTRGTATRLAKKYGVSRHAISRVLHGKSWRA